MSGNQLRLIKIQGCNAVLMIGLSLWLIPRFGIAGAALASTVAVIVTNLWSLATVLRTLNLSPYNAGYKKLAPAAFFSVAVLLALLHASSRIHSIWILAAAGMVCAYSSFLGTLWLFGLEPDDRRLAAVAWNHVEAALRRNGVTR
jgi:O-antigen/teichoic acid export membrane protein